MCGRYAASATSGELVEEFEIDLDATGDPTASILVTPQQPPVGAPDYNMAPTKQAPVILTRAVDGHDVRQLRHLTWGLIPSWSKDAKMGLRMINARAETLLEKPAFKKAALTRRCIVPAEGWYEWQQSPVVTDAKGKPRKQPFYMHRSDGTSCAFAGLYEFWRNPAEADAAKAWVASFSILTTSAGPGLDRIHDRQPIILERADWDEWLDPQVTSAGTVASFLQPGESSAIDAYPVSPAVSAVKNNGVGLLTPLPRSELRGAVDPTTGEILGYQEELDLG